jgi:GntR family transcriptional regulator, rspAB operon transcriptional repressor
MVVQPRQALPPDAGDFSDLPKVVQERSSTIAEGIVEVLREAIVTLRLKPGITLSEQDLAEKFAVSRQPVREAFIRLGGSGLIHVRPQRATRVTHISIDSIEEAHFVRQAVEVEVARLAAKQATRDDVLLLENELELQWKAGRNDDARRFFALDEQFHRHLSAVAGKPNAWRAIEDAKAQLDRVRFLTLLESRPLRQRIEQHVVIVQAIAARKPDAAARAMRSHLRGMMLALPALSRQWPELFQPSED